MVYMTASRLQPGMQIARNITGAGSIPLICAGQKLNEKIIAMLKNHHVLGVYVEMDGTEDIIQEDVLDEAIKSRALMDIKRAFDTFRVPGNKMSSKVVEDVSELSEALVTDLMNKKDIVINLIDLKAHDDYTYSHSLCVSLLSVATGVAMGLSNNELKELSTAALLHDIGKTRIPQSIINKPGKLSEAEWEFMYQHPIEGERMLRKMRTMSPNILKAVEGHHEKYDGSGYPYNLKEDQIHPYARIISICDVYDALTSSRPYSSPCFPSDAIEYVMACSNTSFDYDVVLAFLKKIVAFPVGGMVTLSSGSNAVVIENFSENILRPKVRLLATDDYESMDIDLLHDTSFNNVTIIGMDLG